ncbi:MAG: DsbA family protein [Candidatus Sungbacteria bacterium]|uniref:DsbA family protein n=1 Tax=Candidatus Sungiibacteriota bacterium TaxID=2750080 RepID=A0A931SBT1_9BACT|nr:DsbA family protein [Candidatus Sungbacteria bacterium]
MESEVSNEKNSGSSLLIPGAIIAAGALVALAVIYSGSGGAGPVSSKKTETPPAASENSPPVSGNIADDDPSLGNPEAPVVVVEFSDFQCPFCGRFFQIVEPRLINDYVKTGKVRFVYRDFAFLGPESTWAAAAANCANEQGKFWEYHNYLFEHQNGENQGAFSQNNLKIFAKTLDLETAKFNSCLDSGKYESEIAKDAADGRAIGVSATPTTFVNGVQVTGAVPYEQIKAIIEAELAKANK